MEGPAVAFVDAYPHLLYGAQRATARLALGLAARGRRSVVVVPADGPFPHELRSVGVDVVVLPAPAGLLAYGRSSRPTAVATALPRWWRALAATLRSADVDVVHAADHRGLLLVGPVGALLHRPVVWHVHALQPPSPLDGPASRAVAAVVLPSHRVLATHPGFTSARRGVEVPYPCLLEHELLGTARPASAPSRIVTLARLHRSKGLDVLLDAFAVVRSVVPDAELLIGGGSQPGADVGAELASQAARLGVAEAVHLLGHLDRPHELLAGAAVYVQPSLAGGELLPLSVIDAAGIGLPVVASDVGAMADLVIEGRTGHLLPPGDADALADRLIGLLGDRQLAARMGAAGTALIADRHAPDAFTAGIARVHDAVVRR